MKKLLLMSLILLTSCGARKVAINNTEIKKDSTAITEVATTKQSEVVKEETTNVSVFESNEEIEICPIDTSKVILVDGKAYKNVIIRAKKNKTGSLYTNTKKESETKRIDSIGRSIVVKKEVVKSKTKNIDKKANYWYLVCWLILILIIYLLWRNRRRIFNVL